MRVVQWSTGNVGRHALAGIAAHPDLELTGVWVSTPDKAGRDAGDLAGLGRTLGVAATTDADALVASRPDCVVYTAMAGVVPDSDWELIIGHHVDLDGVRQVAELANRFGTDPDTDTSRSAPRDLLADVAEVLGAEPTPAADVPALLAKAFPRWEPYRRLTGKALRERLSVEYGVKVASTGNRWPIDPKAVRAALARRIDAGN